jgi:NDP-sugar pyrophosphorylase family protein
MHAVVLDIGSPRTLEPLTCTRRLSQVPVANLPLLEAQLRRLQAAGHSIGEPAPNSQVYLTQRGDAWLSLTILRQLAAAAGPVRIQDATGRDLAWVNLGGTVPAGAEIVAADAGSYGLDYPWDLLRVNEELVGALSASHFEGSVSDRAVVEGFLVLGEGSRILPGVYVEGSVIVGRDCKIGPNCYLRGSTSIGDGCHIGQAVEVKNSIIMARTSIGHLSYCGDSIVGEGVNFGAGTITANLRHDGKSNLSAVGQALIDTGRRKLGAVVGDNAHTGIHTSIYPGRKLWPGTWTRPGTVVQTDLDQQSA